MIPAALSWGFGGIVVMGIPFGIPYVLKMLHESQEVDWTERISLYLWMLTPVFMLLSGCLNLYAGWHWIQGRWRLALLLNAVGYGIMFVPETLQQVAARLIRGM